MWLALDAALTLTYFIGGIWLAGRVGIAVYHALRSDHR